MTDRTTAGQTATAPAQHGHAHDHVHGDGCCDHDHGHHHHHGHHHGPGVTLVRSGAKVGRNDPCPCGSGKKHKKCCLA